MVLPEGASHRAHREGLEGVFVKKWTTKELLIEAAERLFAEKGIDAVPLRDIAEAAGQRNASALQYHFGSREGLVEAVFCHRTAAINAYRLAMIRDLLNREGTIAEPDIALVLVVPLARQVFVNAGASYYATFLMQVISSTHYFALLQNHAHYSGIRECTMLYRGLKPDMDWLLLNRRIRMAISAIIREMAIAEKEMNTIDSEVELSAYDLQIANVVDAVSGILSVAPRMSGRIDILKSALEIPPKATSEAPFLI